MTPHTHTHSKTGKYPKDLQQHSTAHQSQNPTDRRTEQKPKKSKMLDRPQNTHNGKKKNLEPIETSDDAKQFFFLAAEKGFVPGFPVLRKAVLNPPD